MEVFIPHLKDDNIYLDEIIRYSNCKFVFGHFTEYESQYKIVNIQFPEAIFNWINPNDEDLYNLEKHIIEWKRSSKIIYTMNDFEAHYDKDKKYNSLFKLIHKYTDGVIHLGKFSLNKYKSFFPVKCIHQLIYHPLYSSLLENFNSKDFQKIFPLEKKNKFIVLVVGSIRSSEEVDFIFNIFKRLALNNKLLIVPRMYNKIKYPKFLPSGFRKYYRNFIKFYTNSKLKKGQYIFGDSYLDYGYLVNLIQNASLLIVPRIRNLNSGNLFLGLTFDKLMVVPKIGNITEIAEIFNIALLDIEKNNYDEISKMILFQKDNMIFNNSDYLIKKDKLHPSKIAIQYDNFFYNILKMD